MYGIIASTKVASSIERGINDPDSIWFKKTGVFDGETFLQYCQAAAAANVQILIVDTSSADDRDFLKGIQQYRLTRDSRIILVAPNRQPGDALIAGVLSLQILDILVPEEAEEGLDEEQLAQSFVAQLQKKPSYADVMRWDVKGVDFKKRKSGTVIQFGVPIPRHRSEEANPSTQLVYPEHDQMAVLQHAMSAKDMPAVPLLVEKIVGSVIVALVGTEAGVGVTHTSILVTNFFRRRGYKVALIEANASDHFAALESIYEGLDGVTTENSFFSIEGVDYYKSSYELNIPELLEQQYDYIVLDMGAAERSRHLNEFYRAHVQIVVGRGAEWRQSKILEFYEAHNARDQSKWHYCLPDADPDVQTALQKKMPEVSLYVIPSQPDPYQVQKNTDSVLYPFLKKYMGERRKRVNIKTFYGVIGGAFAIILFLIYQLYQK